MKLLNTLNENLRNTLKEKNEIKVTTIRQIKIHTTSTEIKKRKH